MTIKYVWKDMEINVLDTNSKGTEPHTKKVAQDVIWYYDTPVRHNDIADYLMPYNLTHKKDKTNYDIEEIRLAKFYMTKVLNFLQESSEIDYDKLEQDTYFVEFMRERYEEQALQDFKEYNDEY